MNKNKDLDPKQQKITFRSIKSAYNLKIFFLSLVVVYANKSNSESANFALSIKLTQLTYSI